MNSYERKQLLLNFANRTDNDSMSDIFYSTTEANSEFSITVLSDIKMLDDSIDASYTDAEIESIVKLNKMQMLAHPTFEAIYKYKLSKRHLP